MVVEDRDTDEFLVLNKKRTARKSLRKSVNRCCVYSWVIENQTRLNVQLSNIGTIPFIYVQYKFLFIYKFQDKFWLVLLCCVKLTFLIKETTEPYWLTPIVLFCKCCKLPSRCIALFCGCSANYPRIEEIHVVGYKFYSSIWLLAFRTWTSNSTCLPQTRVLGSI